VSTDAPAGDPQKVRGLTADFWAGAVVALVGAVGLVGALSIFVPTGLNDYLGPRLFPISISLLVIGMGLALAARTLVVGSTTRPDTGSLRALAILVSLSTVYLVLFIAIGFFLATACFLTATFWYLGERRLWLAMGAAAVVATLVTLTFTRLLNVALPIGPLGL
jgi:putative tricarboxylic transport membrane protein